MRTTDTAFVIARVRAEEARLPESERLFDDPFARLFDEGGERESAIMELFPFHRAHVRLRTRFLDDCVRDALKNAVRQILLLGAGFDCRGLRLPEIPAHSARVLELDLPEQLEKKRATLEAANVVVPDHVRPVPADFGADDLEQTLPSALSRAGFEAGRPALLIGEGLIGYLPRAPIERLARVARALTGSGSTLVVNYHSAAWSTDTIHALLTAAGWDEPRSPAYRELHERWIGAEMPPGSEQYHLTFARH